MMDIFRDFLRYFLEVFIDDFAVFSKRRPTFGISEGDISSAVEKPD